MGQTSGLSIRGVLPSDSFLFQIIFPLKMCDRTYQILPPGILLSKEWGKRDPLERESGVVYMGPTMKRKVRDIGFFDS
uniref:Uncharacterized protein n=1 Tax=Nelumbo nucifera TaxID=4432 RepID=A0A822YH42_NELNU|nr:TPA_asm: hypothetical protein HUJ06_010613 [Nelumbo nucifera]